MIPQDSSAPQDPFPASGPPRPEERFNDPIAGITGWRSMEGPRGFFPTHRLARLDDRRWEYRPTARHYLIAIPCMLGALGILTAVLLGPVDSWWQRAAIGLAVLLGGLAFANRRRFTRLTFDKDLGYYRGSRDPDEVEEQSSMDNYTRLERIHALQILSHRSSGGRALCGYELNLVLKDGTRVNLLDHRDIDLIRTDAADLGGFLGKPVWDASIAG